MRWKYPLALLAAALMIGAMGVGYFYATSPFPPDQDATPQVVAQEARDLNVTFAFLGAGVSLMLVSLIWLVRMVCSRPSAQIEREAVTPAP